MGLPEEQYETLKLYLRSHLSDSTYGPKPNLDEADLSVFIRQLSGESGVGRLAPVRAVQTAAFPGSYVAGTWLASSVGALSATVFDGCSITYGQSVEFNSVDTAAIGNGVFTCLVVGSATEKSSFIRRNDLDENSDFVDGLSYDVLDGVGTKSLKGTRRQLYTQGAVALDSTALEFGPVREQDLTKTDVTKFPYSIRGKDNAGSGDIGLDCSAALNQALYDASIRGAGSGNGSLVRLPETRLVARAPIFQLNYTTVAGAGVGRSAIVVSFQGGALWNFCYPLPPALYTATRIDTSIDQAVELLSADRFYFDLTEMSLEYRGTSGFDFRALMRPKSLGAIGHLTSTRAALLTDLPLTKMHTAHVDATGHWTCQLRTIDNAVIRATGTLPPAVTISGTAVENDVPNPIHVEITDVSLGTARGQAKFRISYNGGLYWEKDPLTNEVQNFTIPAGGVYACGGNADGLILNFPADTYGITQRYTNVQETTLTTVTAYATGHDWELAHNYDGTTTKLALHRIDGVAVPDPSPQSVAQTGKVWEYDYEHSKIGASCNISAAGFGTDTAAPAADVYLASFFYGDTALNITTPHTTLVGAPFFGSAGQKLVFYAWSLASTIGPDGVLRHWECRGAGGGRVFAIPRHVGNLLAVAHSYMRDFFIDCQTFAVTGVYQGWSIEGCGFDRIKVGGINAIGWTCGEGANNFYNSPYRDMQFMVGGKWGFKAGGGVIDIDTVHMAGPKIGMLLDNAVLIGRGQWFFDGTIKPYCGFVFNQCGGTISNDLIVSDESTGYLGGGRMQAGVVASTSLFPASDLLVSNGYSLLQRATPFLMTASSVLTTGDIWIGVRIVVVNAPSHMLKVCGTQHSQKIRALPGFNVQGVAAPLINVAGAFVGVGGRAEPVALDAAALTSATVLTADDRSAVNYYTIIANQVAALDALRLAGGIESTEFWITLLGTQANDLLVKDDASGDTIDTLTAGLRGTFRYRKDGTSGKYAQV